MRKLPRASIAVAAAVLLLSAVLTAAGVKRAPAPDCDRKRAAAELMQVCMDRIRLYKEEAGLTLSEEDIHGTWLIGAPYTMVTTTIGALEAKRTTANPDMAALAVQLLKEAGVGPGDRVGAAFSGSFPGLNLAVLSACQVMEVELVYICSAGASTYGANQPELTFPEMAHRLVEDGILSQDGVAVSMGGDFDCGMEMYPDLRDNILARLKQLGPELIWEEDYAKNLALRRAYYEAEGPIQCFIGVGGSITTLGLAEDQLDCGVTPPYTIQTITKNSGLMELYNAEGLPVIHLLNIKQLAADYGLPYDPQRLPAPGESAVYHTARYPWHWAGGGLAAATMILLSARRRGRGGAALLLSLVLLLAGCGGQGEEGTVSSAGPDSPPPAEGYPPELLPGGGAEPADWTLDDFPGVLEERFPGEEDGYPLLEGTELENTVRVLEGAKEGPVLYLVAGVHGDETAGWLAGNLLKQATLKAGRLCILSPANLYGAEHDQRNTRSDRDLNRNFPGDPQGWDAEQLAAAIFEDIRDKSPALVLDLHEARVRQGERDDLGNSVICHSLDGVGDLVLELLVASGEGGLCASPVTLYDSPPPGSVNRTVTTELGIPVITVETSRGEPLAQRVRNQLELVEYVLEYYGLR